MACLSGRVIFASLEFTKSDVDMAAANVVVRACIDITRKNANDPDRLNMLRY